MLRGVRAVLVHTRRCPVRPCESSKAAKKCALVHQVRGGAVRMEVRWDRVLGLGVLARQGPEGVACLGSDGPREGRLAAQGSDRHAPAFALARQGSRAGIAVLAVDGVAVLI